MFSYEGKKAIVTGGGRGIGKAIALAFARQGAVVALAARSRDELENAAAEVEKGGGKAWIFPTDISDTEAAQNMVEEAAKAMGGLDILVNNAGGGLDAPGAGGEVIDTTPDGFDFVFRLNVRSPLYATTTAARHMISQGRGGAVLTMVSVDGLFPAPTEALYGAAKAAMVNFTQCLAYELGRHRIRVNAIAPGVVETQLTAPWLQTEEQRRDRSSFYPLGRVGQVDDIASAAVYLCSDEAGWVSGVTLLVAGGSMATSDVFRITRKHNAVPESMKI
jgi:NAD(P)-dependent dehydrogenase (short-subunit alcohol dehydrogenase family)